MPGVRRNGLAMTKTIGNASFDALAKVAAQAGREASAEAREKGHAVTGTRTLDIDGTPTLCVVRVEPSGSVTVLKVLGGAATASGGAAHQAQMTTDASRKVSNHKH